MYLVGALIAFLIGNSFSTDITEVPFAQLTLKLIFSSLFAIVLYIAALMLLWRSFLCDMLWPWKWRWNRYFWGNVFLKITLVIAGVWYAIYYVDSHHYISALFQYGIAVAAFIFILCVSYMDEFTMFDETKLEEKRNFSQLFHECCHCHVVGLKPGILDTKHCDYGMRNSFRDAKELFLNKEGLCDACAHQFNMEA